MSVLFVGSVYPKDILEYILKEETHIDFAANNFQLSLMEGFSSYYDDITLITSPVTSPYPKSNKLVYKRTESIEVIGKNIRTIFTGFINVPLVKMVSEYYKVRREVKRKLNGNDTIYIYALHSSFLYAIYSLRKRIAKVCVVVPDLPEHMSHNKGYLRRLLKKLNCLIINKCVKEFDYYVLLSPFMKNILPIYGKKWIQVEGIYSSSGYISQINKENKKTILYTGVLSSSYGVFDLIEAFMKILGDDYQLWLCGSCRSEMELLKEYIIKDSRIKYLGMLKTEEVRELQGRATLLVNPRHSTEEFTKYSFPSKTMEYLASGTATLMCRLPAIPEEYKNYLFFFEDESIDAMAKRLEEICSMDQKMLMIHGKASRDFILKNKNCFAQAKRIMEMVEDNKYSINFK